MQSALDGSKRLPSLPGTVAKVLEGVFIRPVGASAFSLRAVRRRLNWWSLE